MSKISLEEATMRALQDRLTKATNRKVEGKYFDYPTTLDDILKMLGSGEISFDDEGNLTDDGQKALDKLYSILRGLNHIGAIEFDEDNFDAVVDEIIYLGY